MPEIISFHAFRRGAGTSSLTASVAALLAVQGYRVGVVDADLQSPSAHILFGLENIDIYHTLTDYLQDKCAIEQAVYDVTPNLGTPISGQIFLAPGSSDPLKIMHILRHGYEVTALTDVFAKLVQDYSLNYLLLDVTAGITDESLASLAIADVLVLVLRLDQQGYQGTGVLLEVARKMRAARMFFVVNDVPAIYNLEDTSARVAQTYGISPDFVIPHADEMLALASTGIFSLRYPEHTVTKILSELTARLIG
jgi:septum site-determining protein MinD